MAFIISLLIAVLCIATTTSGYPPIQPCPGEGPRYGDFKCNHDRTHRVCAQLVDNSNGQCKELAWNDDQQSFWQITGQERWNWKTRICNPPNPGDSWCICMWATENLITEVGCDNVHINCAATDVPYLLRSVSDGGWDLSTARDCIKKKCPEYTTGTDSTESTESFGPVKSCNCKWITKEGMKMKKKIRDLPIMAMEDAKIECETKRECKAITCRSEKACWLNAKSVGKSDPNFTALVKEC